MILLRTRSLGFLVPAFLGAAAEPAAAQSSILPSSRTASAAYAGFGFAVGGGRIAVGYGTGEPVLYTGGGQYPGAFWAGVAFRGSSSTYEPVFVSRLYDAPLRRIAIGDISGDARKEIVVALTDGRFYVYDEATRAPILEFAAPPTSFSFGGAIALFDLDGDGKEEILLTAWDGLTVFSGVGVPLWNLGGIGGDDVIAGQFDDDPSPEIIAADGTVVDWATRTVQWSDPGGFGIAVARADIDADGKDELLAALSFNSVRAYDVDLQQVKWSIPASDLGSLDVADVDGNGVPDVVFGENQFGDAEVYDTQTQQRIGSVHNPDSDIQAIRAGDFDQDGVVEVAFATGIHWTGPKHLIVGNPANGSIEWKGVELDGPFVGPLRGDLDGDGHAEIVAACSHTESGYAGRLLVLEPDTLALRAMSPAILPNGGSTGVADIALCDIDGDGSQEILLGGESLLTGFLQIYHWTPPSTFALLWTNATHPNGESFTRVGIADVDGDGALDVVGGSARVSTASPGPSVQVYSLATGAETWRSPLLNTNFDQITGLALDDLDGDGIPEIAALPRTAGVVSVFDGATKALEATIPGPFRCLDTDQYFVGPTVHREIVLGDANGDVSRYEVVSGSYALVAATHVSTQPVEQLSAANRGVLWAGTRKCLRLYLGLNPHPLWASEPYGRVVGSQVLMSPGAATRVFTCSEVAVLGF